ncbi:MAG: hypothetical protein QOF58_7356 [Pseudonocardiales bacterium]|jgi:hypothetical protein|nr:hypothetical protein [Pseudonocardiales bacterium]
MIVGPADGGAQVEMGKKVVKGWRRVFLLLEMGYGRFRPLFMLLYPLSVPTTRALLRNMYPAVAPSRRESKAFLRRHRDVLADRELVRRVRARWCGPQPIILTHDEVDEWIAVMGQARSLCELLVFSRKAVAGASIVQALLVAVVDPDAYRGPWSEPVTAEQAATDQTV